MTTPNLQLSEMPSNSLQPSAPFNASMQALDALVQLSVETITATPPTTTSADVGKRWIVGASATGVWAGKDGQIALCTAADTWTYYVPQEGWRADVKDVDLQYRYDGIAWDIVATGVISVNGDTGEVVVPVPLCVACSDETTSLTAGAAKVTFRMPFAMTLTAVPRASLSVAQASGPILTIDVNENGASIFSTPLTVDNGEKTSTTAATPAVLADTSLADDAEITIDIDQVGDGTAKGLKLYLIGHPA